MPLLSKQDIEAAFGRFASHNPSPTTELEYGSPYQLLIAVILSAQSTDKGVNRVTQRLFAKATDAKAMVQLGEENLQNELATLGLYRAKARHVMATSKILLEHYAGQVPEQREALESLPGVGRKTANVILNTIFQYPVIAVDTHVFRVARRLGLSARETVEGVEKDLHKRVPKAYKLHAHHWLILHGRYWCVARKPKCESCFLNDLCPSSTL